MNRDICAHEWQEGGPRYHGRYHCARCQLPLYPLTEMANRDKEIASLRSRLSAADAAKERAEKENERLREALTKLRDEAADWGHPDGCDRQGECDEADEDGCPEHCETNKEDKWDGVDRCPPCECGREVVLSVVRAALNGGAK